MRCELFKERLRQLRFVYMNGIFGDQLLMRVAQPHVRVVESESGDMLRFGMRNVFVTGNTCPKHKVHTVIHVVPFACSKSGTLSLTSPFRFAPSCDIHLHVSVDVLI